MNFHETEVPTGPDQQGQAMGDVTLFPNGLARIGNRTFPDQSMINGYEFAPGCRVDREAGTRLIRVIVAGGEEFRFRYSAYSTKWYRQTLIAPTLQEQIQSDPAQCRPPWTYYVSVDGDRMVFLRKWWWAILWLSASVLSAFCQ